MTYIRILTEEKLDERRARLEHTKSLIRFPQKSSADEAANFNAFKWYKERVQGHRFQHLLQLRGQVMSDDGMGWIPGLGDNKPQSRLLGKSFFGYVPDAFSMKTPEMPSEKSSQKGSKETSAASSPVASVGHRRELESLSGIFKEDILKVGEELSK
ncbi:uncharacterized protein LOC110839323, partial [Zootermopsis nevadensis]|uniref:uncharacterized protein LOC110839323 n=1 Tax=Zootermopsis nevadensis TaxID=136037 RepID=UPI000B8EBE00